MPTRAMTASNPGRAELGDADAEVAVVVVVVLLTDVLVPMGSTDTDGDGVGLGTAGSTVIDVVTSTVHRPSAAFIES